MVQKAGNIESRYCGYPVPLVNLYKCEERFGVHEHETSKILRSLDSGELKKWIETGKTKFSLAHSCVQCNRASVKTVHDCLA